MARVGSLLGVIHLPPLPGSPGASARGAPSTALQQAGLLAVREAQILEKAGFDGLILENFGDVPFFKDRVPPETVASLSVIAAAVRESVRIPVGINVLRNDARAALTIAAITGCDFIRVNVLTGVVATDQGLIEGEAATLLRERVRLGASGVSILADVHVKHARTLSSDDVAQAAEDTLARAGAEGVIVSGAGTGKPVDLARLGEVAAIARRHGAPVYVGSGARLESLADLHALGAGVIVSSALRKGGRPGAPLEPAKARAFAAEWGRLGRRRKTKKRRSRPR